MAESSAFPVFHSLLAFGVIKREPRPQNASSKGL
jgi:hypothetical protein